MALSFDKVNKVITVLSPDTEITIQNLLNSIREWEDELTSIDMPIVASCAGKEPLGGGVVVGLTLTLLDDWQLAFEARSGPSYIQCTVSGGNIVAVHVNGPVYPTAFTQVLITASSSATQSDLEAIQYSSYQNAVWVDTASANSGTDYPVGTREYPVNNVIDAIIIGNTKGFSTLKLLSNVIFTTGHNISDFEISGVSHITTNVNIEPGADCQRLRLNNCTFSGTLDGDTEVRRCVIEDIIYFSGHIHDSGLKGTITLAGNEKAMIDGCRTIDQDNPAHIDMGGTGQSLAMPNYSGIIHIKNLTDATQEVGIGINAGLVQLEDTITAGTFIIAGTGMLVDDSTSVTSLNTDALMNKYNIAEAVRESYISQIYVDVANGSSGTAAPLGTEKFPVNNLPDALSICVRENVFKLDISGSLTITTGQDVSGYTLFADRSLGNTIVVNSGAITTGTYFENLTVSGIMNGSVRYTTCVLGAISNFDGGAKNSLITENILVTGSGYNYLTECDTYITDSSLYKKLTVGNSELNIIKCRGNFEIAGKTSTSTMAIDLVAGTILVDVDCTAGEIYIDGITHTIDNSAVGCEVNVRNSISENIEDISYTDKFIYINTEAVENGNGKSSYPFNNISDAVDYAESVGWRKLVFLADATLERTLKNFTIEGIGLPTIDLNGQTVDRSEFFKVKLFGDQVGSITAREVVLTDGMTGVNGIYRESAITGDITLADNALISLSSIVSVFTTPTIGYHTIDMGVSNTTVILNIRKMSGFVGLLNCNTATKLATISFSGGKCELNDTNTAGTIGVAGIPFSALTDNTGASCTVITDGVFPSKDTILDAVA